MSQILGKVNFELPEPLVPNPYKLQNFFPEDMFKRVVQTINASGMGPGGHLKYHTMIGRWDAGVSFDKEIEDFCISRAREIFNDDTLEKAYFFACRYQIQNGCIPNLWEHTDQNGTQTTIDVAIENTANWNLIVEREEFTQEPNSAMIFAGQQHMHARPPYPSDDENVYTTVLFLHFTQPSHWIQKEKNGLHKYGSDGDVRYFNRNRFVPMPDPPFEQPICPCHDYGNVLRIYDGVCGRHVDSEPELVDMPILDTKVLAPGIVEFQFPEESARILKGLTHNFTFAMWGKGQVLNNNRADVNYSARRCYTKFINKTAESCHPQDPLRRLWESLENGVDPMLREYKRMYSVRELESVHWQLVRYEQGNMFHKHFDDCAEFPRVLSVSVFLNDDYSGGDLEFEHFNLRIVPKAGKVVFFGSSYPYMHSVSPVTRGIRYAAVKWYNHAGKESTGT